MKKKILNAAAVLAALLFIWLGNEGSKPLVLKGTDLNQTAGVSDYTGLIAIDETAAYYGMFAYTDDYVLDKGTYTIRPEYSNTSIIFIISSSNHRRSCANTPQRTVRFTQMTLYHTVQLVAIIF